METTIVKFKVTEEILNINTMLFICEHGIKLGVGYVIRSTDDEMFVRVDWTDRPHVGHLTYMLISDAAGLEGS